MADEIARFQAEVRRLALDIAQSIFRREFELAPTRRSERSAERSAERPAKRQGELPLPAPRQRKQKPGRPPKRAPRELDAAGSKPEAAPPADAQTTLPLEVTSAGPGAGAPDAAAGASASATPATAPAPSAAPATGRTRTSWTRESIINELATWMAGGTVIDAAFVRRHGPPGLVAATRRVFGRFEAGLNVAALHVSKLYPDGPPSSRSSG
jgi:hypothetical protein